MMTVFQRRIEKLEKVFYNENNNKGGRYAKVNDRADFGGGGNVEASQ